MINKLVIVRLKKWRDDLLADFSANQVGDVLPVRPRSQLAGWSDEAGLSHQAVVLSGLKLAQWQTLGEFARVNDLTIRDLGDKPLVDAEEAAIQALAAVGLQINESA